MVLTYMTLLVLFVGPVGLGWYLQGFASITEERLAALTVTSPFSAALSVPMHASRSTGANGRRAARASPHDPGRRRLRLCLPGLGLLPRHLPPDLCPSLWRDLPGLPLPLVAIGRYLTPAEQGR